MEKHVFENNGTDFSGWYAAEKWLRENGYSFGSMQRDANIGIKKGDCLISKWRNLSVEDIEFLDGRVEFGI